MGYCGMSVTRLRDVNDEPDEDVLDLLVHALEMAESGEIRSIAIAAALTGGKTFTAYETRDIQEAIGLVGFLHHTLCAKQRETLE